MKALRIIGLSLFTVVASAWTYVGVGAVTRNETLLPALIFGALCMLGFIVVALHKEVFE